MPYEKKSELPDPVKENLPSHAQEIYKEAYNVPMKNIKNLKTDMGMTQGRKSHIKLLGPL
jgi:cation transport regulator